MITAVDTNVLVDVFGADRSYGGLSAAAVRSCSTDGRLVACEVVWAELGSVFPNAEDAAEALDRIAVDFSAVEQATALAAGEVWREYRRRGGARTRIVADFLIGAHAGLQADRLLTRDRGFYRTYFAELEVVDPTQAP